MRTALFLAALAALSAQTAPPAAWRYPRDAARRDPVLPPAALYSGDGFPELRVLSIAHDPADARDSRALVVLTGGSGGRSVVRAGDRVGPYRVLAVRRACLAARQNVLGSDRPVEICLARPGEAARP